MLSLLRCFRERGWQPIDAADYARIWQQFGGSVITHPEVVARLAALSAIPVRYLGFAQRLCATGLGAAFGAVQAAA